MKPSLIIIDEDYYIRADLICAITVSASDDDDGADLNVYLMGREDPIVFWFQKWAEAEKAQVEAVDAWLASFGR